MAGGLAALRLCARCKSLSRVGPRLTAFRVALLAQEIAKRLRDAEFANAILLSDKIL